MPALPTESLLRRAAIGFWFWLIAALGLVQFHGRAFRTGAFEPGPIAWTWLAGSIVLILAGLFIVVRAARYTSTSHVDQT